MGLLVKNDPNGIMDEPMLRAWQQDSVPPDNSYDDRPGRWIAERQWPTANVQERRYALLPYKLVAASENQQALSDTDEYASMEVQSPLSVGLEAGKWCSYTATPDLPGDQREEDGGSLIFSTPSLTEPLYIFGMPELALEVSSNKPQAMLAVRLSDVGPDGKSTRVSYGLLNLTHRDGDSHPEPLEPHRRYRVTIPLNGIAQQFPAGHQLRVSISTSYWPLAWLPPEPAKVRIYLAGCQLTLPVREPQTSDADLSPFDTPKRHLRLIQRYWNLANITGYCIATWLPKHLHLR
ncbi:hypothetical protein HORIV_56890 [Vreelandella olivaria]|uniref:Xaa-Pro dipeptidyl-peptidase C-terminal domain-containing protein n=1 Tax=Vreelandella olivaria TaxID=390919 RepID=A0ABN5X313_9GAMM|nr:hypothetical protein HORIV_56890 [Halomonas olivaria]